MPWPLVGRGVELEVIDDVLGDPGVNGVVVHGPAGVGKTRLAEEWLRRAGGLGHPLARVVANRTSATVPLGAVAHLLPPGAVGDDPLTLFAAAREQLAGGPRLVVHVDDAHLLDTASLTLLTQLGNAGVLVIVGTVRSGEPVPDVLTAGWRSRTLLRVDLPELDREAVETLLHLALGGPVDGRTSAAIWSTCGGNVLFLRELVLGTLASGRLVEDHGAIRLVGELTGTGRVSELVAERLDAVDTAAARLLETLAHVGPLGLVDAETIAGGAALEEVEKAGLVDVDIDRRRRTVRLSHPVHGEVIRGRTGVLRARSLLLEHADRIESHGARRREDPLIIATLRLDAGAHVDPTLLLDAANAARAAHDYTSTSRLASIAWEDAPSPAIALLLGEAGYELGRFDESESVLRAGLALADALPDGAGLRARLARMLSTTLFWGQLRPAEALDAARAAAEASTDPADRYEALTAEASLLVFGGRPAEAIDLLEQIDRATGDSGRLLVQHAVPAASGLVMQGRMDDALEIADRAFAVHLGLGDIAGLAHPGTHMINKIFALTESGRFDEAEDLGHAGYELAVAEDAPLALGWVTMNLARTALIRGRPATALRWFREATSVAAGSNFIGPRRQGLAGQAAASALLGDVATAEACVAAFGQEEGEFRFLEQEAAQAQSWLLVAKGELAAARDVLAEAGRAARATGHKITEALLCHDRARLGAPAEVVDDLDRLAAECDGRLVAARARHARALVAGEPVPLVAVADEFGAMGMHLVAAEASSAAADAHRRAGDQRAAAAAVARSRVHANHAEGASTPGMAATSAVEPLTAREREIASLAAGGATSKTIAESLFVSVRTVDNHLQKVYAKLGVSGRGELTAAMSGADVEAGEQVT